MTIVQGPDEDYPFKVECHKNYCFFSATMKTYEEAQRWDKEHSCPYGATVKFGASVTASILEKAWALLDQYTGTIQALAKDHPERPIWVAKAQGVAEVLALFMPPHYRTVNEISREALARYRDAQEGKAHETRGLGALKYTFPDDPKYKRPEAKAAHEKEKAAKGTQEIAPEDLATIKFMAKMSTVEQVVAMFPQYSKATVERVWSES